jgi:adenosylcobinamide-GDP ribazoletransferase
VIRELLVALQFLTRIPIRMSRSPTGHELGRSLLWYPLVGILIGALLLLVQCMTTGVPPALRASLLLVMWVWLSGAMHLDGLADTADAWVGGRGDRDRTLEIMKDPRCGAMGVTVVALLLLVKFAALSTLVQAEVPGVGALVLAPLLGRVAITALVICTPYVRSTGIGMAMSAQAPRGPGAAIVVCACAAVALAAGREGLWALAATIGAFLVLRASAMGRIGGMTGDVAGALVEILEATVLATSVIAGGAV